MNITVEQLKNLILKYDRTNGEFPASSYEGLSVYQFICQELGIESDIENDLFDVAYYNLLKKTSEENTNESTT